MSKYDNILQNLAAFPTWSLQNESVSSSSRYTVISAHDHRNLGLAGTIHIHNFKPWKGNTWQAHRSVQHLVGRPSGETRRHLKIGEHATRCESPVRPSA